MNDGWQCTFKSTQSNFNFFVQSFRTKLLMNLIRTEKLMSMYLILQTYQSFCMSFNSEYKIIRNTQTAFISLKKGEFPLT